MRYLALACDYDGTLAHRGVIASSTLQALQRAKASGRKLVLVTGRQWDDLLRLVHDITVFDRVVAENGAIVHEPAKGSLRSLGAPPPEEFVARLIECGVPISCGRVICSTHVAFAPPLLHAIQEKGLALQVIYNRDSAMVLPAGVDKASGVSAAADDLGIPLSQMVGIGDAENDEALLTRCGLAVAVDNAVESIKAIADYVTPAPDGAGVARFIDEHLLEDCRRLQPKAQK